MAGEKKCCWCTVSRTRSLTHALTRSLDFTSNNDNVHLQTIKIEFITSMETSGTLRVLSEIAEEIIRDRFDRCTKLEVSDVESFFSFIVQ